MGGGRSTLKFVESLGTAKGWEDLGHGFVDLAQMGLVVSSANGIMLRSQMTNSIVWAVEDLPNKTAYQWGYGVGYGAEKVVEGALLSKGAGWATNAMRSSKRISGILGLESGVAKGGVNAVEQVAVQGNSLKSLRPTWGYKLYSADGTFLKNGITSKLIPETRYTRAFMLDKKMVPFKQFPNRLEAYQWEFGQNQILRGPLNLNMH